MSFMSPLFLFLVDLGCLNNMRLMTQVGLLLVFNISLSAAIDDINIVVSSNLILIFYTCSPQVVLRRLPPSLSKDQLEEQLSPLPSFDYFEFFPADQRCQRLQSMFSMHRRAFRIKCNNK